MKSTIVQHRSPSWLHIVGLVLALSPALPAQAALPVPMALPMPDHVVMVIEENRSFSNIIGNASAPFINSLAAQGALMTQSFGIDHASQPNYLQLFSGSNQGVTDNSTPHAFNSPNLRSALASQGLSFGGYSESLPSIGFTGSSFTTVPGLSQYQRKHNPWVNWQGAAANAVPAGENLPFSSFPTTAAEFASLPTVAFVVPNEQNDMHDGSIAMGDAWLQTRLQGYINWAQSHNSLLILSFDEDNGSENNHIATLFVGPMVVPGLYSQTISHLHVLRTLTDLYGLPAIGDSAGVQAISGIFVTTPVPEPGAAVLLLGGLPVLWWYRRRTGRSGLTSAT